MRRVRFLLFSVFLLGCGGGGGVAPPPSVTLTVSPRSATVLTGATQQFTAVLTGNPNQSVTWSVNGVTGGNAVAGTINAAGLYTAPDVPPVPNTVTVKATSVADSTLVASASVAVVNPLPVLTSVSPNSVVTNGVDLAITANGSAFTGQSNLLFNDTALATTFVSSVQLTGVVPSALLAKGGAYQITVSTPGPGGGTSTAVTLTVNQTPALTSASSTTFLAGTTGKFTVTTTGFPVPTLSETGALPGGVSFNSATGVLSGIPALGTGGVYNLTFKATNGVGSGAAQNFALTVNQAPALTSASNTTFLAGTAGSFTVTATGYPVPSLSETGALPGGVSFNSSTGVLSGTPAIGSAGVYNISFTASNSVGTNATQNFTLTVDQAPALTSASSTTFLAGAAGSFTVTATGYPVPSLSETGALPGGVSFNSSTGMLSGTPAIGTGGVYNLTFKATNGVGSGATQNFTLTVANPAPSLTSITPTSINSGSPDTTVFVTGTNFVPSSVVQANGTSLSTAFSNTVQLSATIPLATLANAGTLTVTVMTPSPGGGTTAGAAFKVLPVVSVSPSSPSVVTGQAQNFSATVSGTSNQSVTWSIQGAGTGNATVGTISSSGVYTAPAIVPNPTTVTIQATSQFDNTSLGTATVTVTSPVEDWPRYRHDLSNTGRSNETFISSANVGSLKQKWSFTTPGGQVSATPAIASINGTRMVFIGSWNGNFYALNADTGAQIWSFTIDAAPATGSCATSPISCTRIASSAEVANNNVYFGAGNGYVYALDAATGSKVWGTQLGDPTQGVEIWSSPAVYNGLVYVGVASHNDAPCVPGRVIALNAGTGAVAWTFNATDQNIPGVGVWSSPAIDVSVSPTIVYIGTGNPGNSCVPSASGTPSFSYPDGILALNASTGVLISFFPAITNDTNDCCDFGSSPVLHSTNQCTLSGNTSWITEANKNGSVFTLPRGSSGTPSTSPPPADLGILGSGELIASPALIPNTSTTGCNHIYVPSEAGYLYDLQQAGDGTGAISVNNSPPWPVAVNVSGGCATVGNCPLYSAPASMTDILLFGGGDGNFYVYNTSGQRLFSFGTFGLVASGPAISNSRVYFGSYGAKNTTTGLRDGVVYCLSINGQ